MPEHTFLPKPEDHGAILDLNITTRTNGGSTMNETSYKPTRKVLSAALVTAALYIVSRFTEVDKDTEQFVNVVAPIIVAYLVPNENTPGGVPRK